MSETPKVIFTYADLSTAHLPKPEMDEITAAPPRVIEHEFGAWVNVLPTEDTVWWDDFPHLFDVIRWARRQGVRWINFDRDGELVDELPTWEW